MLSYDNCPNKLPCVPDYATIDGKPILPIADFKSFTTVNYNPADYTGCAPNNFPQWVSAIDQSYNPLYMERAKSTMYLPTLCTIGLSEALCEVEAVLSWNESQKHPGSKWKSKNIDWHDSKAVSHLNQAQCGELIDSETKCRHRAHAICRLLMSLQRELKG